MIMQVGTLAEHGFLPGEWGGEPTECADHKCERVVKKGDECFIDMQSSSVYCDGCGKCKRYVRKRAEQREVQLVAMER